MRGMRIEDRDDPHNYLIAKHVRPGGRTHFNEDLYRPRVRVTGGDYTQAGMYGIRCRASPGTQRGWWMASRAWRRTFEAIHQPSIPSRAARRRTGFLARLRAPWVANPKGKLHVAPAASNQARRVRGGLAGVIPRQRSNPSLLPHPERHHSGCSEDGRRGNGPVGNTGHPVPCEAVRIRPRGCRQLYNHGPAGGFRQIARSASGRCAKRRRRFGAPQRATSAGR